MELFKYDIFNDVILPIQSRDIATLQMVFKAYGQVRAALGKYEGSELRQELNLIHQRLKQRIDLGEPA